MDTKQTCVQKEIGPTPKYDNHSRFNTQYDVHNVQDVKWDVGREYTPADAVAQVFRSVALTDLRGLVRNLSDWFDSMT